METYSVGVEVCVVTLCCKVDVELFISEDDRMVKVMHSLPYIDHDKHVVGEQKDIVLVDDYLDNGGDWDKYIFVFCHYCPQVKIFDVNSGILCTSCGDGRVDVELYGGESNRESG